MCFKGHQQERDNSQNEKILAKHISDRRLIYTTYDRLLFSLKRNKIVIHATKWMSPENMLSEISQAQNGKYCLIPFVWGTSNSQIHRKQNGGFQELEEGKNCNYCFMSMKLQFVIKKKVLEMEGSNVCTTTWMHNNLKMVKMISFLLCIPYHNKKYF